MAVIDEEHYIAAHKLSDHNRKYLSTVKKCGCVYCQAIFATNEIKEWADEPDVKQVTAICPYCGIDAVISEGHGFPINKEFLKEMHKKWF